MTHEELLMKAKAAKSAEDLIALAKENGFSYTEEEIKAYFPGMEVLCDDLSLGICCHTGEGALGIGCSCRPRR